MAKSNRVVTRIEQDTPQEQAELAEVSRIEEQPQEEAPASEDTRPIAPEPKKASAPKPKVDIAEAPKEESAPKPKEARADTTAEKPAQKASATKQPEAKANKRVRKARVTVAASEASGEPTTANRTNAPQTERPKKAQPQPVGGILSYLSLVAPGHERALLGGIIGLLVALLAFAIGPGRTLVIMIFVLIGVTIGLLMDGNVWLITLVKKLLGEEDDK